jgi:hypothetical protein
MAGHNLTIASSLACPHGGTVAIAPGGERALAGGAVMVTIADVFTISGCPYVLPTTPPTPSPCLVVQWSVGQARLKIGGVPALDETSVGLCIGTGPQGAVVVVATQTSVQGQ